MKNIDQSIYDKIQLSSIIYKYPILGNRIKDVFNPNIDSQFIKYMIIDKEPDYIKISEQLMFLHENPSLVKKMSKDEIIDGTWWIL